MSLLGGKSPFPYALGGGPSATEQIYNTLKQHVGTGGSAEEQTIESEWRLARSRAVAAGLAMERAIAQGIPSLVTSYMPVWEEILYLVTNEAASDQVRRTEIIDRVTRQIEADHPKLELQLQEIDPLFSIIASDAESSRTTTVGRGFEDWDTASTSAVGPAFGGGRTFTAVPNFSSDFICTVSYDIDPSGLSNEQLRRIQRARDVLNEVLPSWVDWRIFIGTGGFILDESLLDLGAFNP